MLEDRRSDVLRALVEEHILTGEPVSSRSILERAGLGVSAATVRNDLASLEREGYVVQPHTSAGRIPTARAYRYYVDHLEPKRLEGPVQQRISGFFSSVHLELSRLLRATSQLLAEVTHYPAVVTGPNPRGERVIAVHLIPLATDHALLVVVTESGRVMQEQIHMEALPDPRTVAEVEHLLNRACRGREWGQILPPTEPTASSEGVGRLSALAFEAMRRAPSLPSDVYVGGTGHMAAVWDNLTTVHRVLEVLEREAEILSLLAHAPGTTIRIGEELGVADGTDMAVVSTTYEAPGGDGSIGVIGPMRMDYKTAISAVERIGRELGDRIGT